jgi:hypothetical protein
MLLPPMASIGVPAVAEVVAVEFGVGGTLIAPSGGKEIVA